jgi:MarR family transcriptional regulator for hemolysin
MPPPRQVPIGLVLARVAKRVSRAFDDALTQAGGSRPAWLILLALKADRPATQRDLAAAVGIEGATLTYHLNAMEQAGLITRERLPENRRVQRVAMTDQGEALFERLRDAARAHDARLRAGLGADGLAALREALERLESNVTPSRD